HVSPVSPLLLRCVLRLASRLPPGEARLRRKPRRIAPVRDSGYPAVWPYGSVEGWQSGRMRRSRKPFRAVSSDEGSNPSPSASQAESRCEAVSAFSAPVLALPPETARDRLRLALTGAQLARTEGLIRCFQCLRGSSSSRRAEPPGGFHFLPP